MLQGTICKYTHYFTVNAHEARLRIAMKQYQSEFLIEKQLKKSRGRFRMENHRFWWRRSLRNGARAFNINEYDAFMEYVGKWGFTSEDFVVREMEVSAGDPVELEVEGFEPWSDQVPLINHAKGDRHQYAVTLQPGGGKQQRLSSAIKVPGGWSTMGEMYVGKVITRRDGGVQRVTGVFPQGVTKVRRVHFADGRYTDAGPEHLWEIRIRSNERSRVVTTDEIQRLLELNNDRSKRITVPLCLPEDGPDLDLPIHPYILGVILGDGHISKDRVTITKNDKFIYDKVKSLLPAELTVSRYVVTETRGNYFSIITSEYGRRHGFKKTMLQDLRAMGLDNRRANDKFIPPDYLNGSLQQRYDLLQGLMDTDGTVDDKSTISYSSVSPDLSKDVQYLARSLGGIASLSTRTPKYSYKGEKLEGQVDNRVFMRMPVPESVFSLPRKKRLARKNQYTDELRLRVVRVEERPDEATQCISVDSEDHLYITDDFIVTHNTIIALFVASIYGVRFAVVTKGGYEGRWIPALYNTLGLQPEEVRSCCGAKAIVKLIAERKKKGIDGVKAVFFSIGGIRDYIKNYEEGLYEGKINHDVPPEELYEFLGIGFRIVDEAHEEIHAHYIADLYTNLPHSLYLTGTLIPRNEFMASIYEKFLPEKIRKSEDKFNVYVKAVEVFYHLKNPDDARYTGSQGSYSHTTYEQWIMKDEVRLNNWLSGVYDYIVSVWAANRVEETKIILFAATIELGAKMAAYFARRMPDLRVIQYKAGDPYDYLIDNDVIFATLGKAGTAVDIPDLEQVHLTTAIDSANAYVQAFGRLRDLLKRFPNITPEFHWYTCLSIQKQIDYGKRKRDVLKPRVLGFRSEYLSKQV